MSAEAPESGESQPPTDSPAVVQAPKASSDVFVSCASQDAAVAAALVEALERHGVACWLAPRDVTPGAQYADAIVRAIIEAKTLVLVLSASAIASSHVGREVERAASKHKQIIAFRIDAALLSPALEYFLGESQWIDVPVLGMSAALTKLAGAVGQASATAAHESPATHRGGSTPKRVAIAAAILVCVGAAVALGMHFWLLNHRAAQPAAAAAITDKSIAVLPFLDLSEKKDQEYFADGMAEEILNLLVKIPELKVIGRTSSFQFKGKADDLRKIGTSLGAAYIVEGSVRRYGDHVRVTAQLIDTHTAAHRWAESYDRDLGDVLVLQSQIATSIARALQLAVGADDTRRSGMLHSTEAYTLYLRGRSAYDGPRDIPEAQSDYEQALALDPSFVRAAEALAWMYAYAALTQEMQSSIAWQHAKDAAEMALRIDGDSAPGHAVLGLMHAEYEYDWDAADTEFSKALSLNPRDPMTLDFAARLACHRGRYEDALRRIDASLAVDPLNPRAHRRKGFILYLAGDDSGAEREFRRSLEIIPTFDWDHVDLAWILVARGEFQAAVNELKAEPAPAGRDHGLAIAYHALGRNAESDAALARLKEEFPNGPTQVALVYAYRGEQDQAFEWLEKAYTQRDPDLLLWFNHPFLRSLRGDPRYKALLHKLKLPE